MTPKVQGKVHAEFGVPVITAENRSVGCGLIENPEGKPVALQVYGRVPPAPVTMSEYGTPTTPGLMVVVVMLGVTCANTSGEKLNAMVNMAKTGAPILNREIIAAQTSYRGTLLFAGDGRCGIGSGLGAVAGVGCCGTSSGGGTGEADAIGRTMIRGSAEEASRMAIGSPVRSLKRNTEAPFSARKPVA